jgi:hypothetical protein
LAIEPSYRSAAFAGLWSALGLVPYDAWLHHDAAHAATYGSVGWFVMLGLFVYLPGYHLVFGRGATRFGRDWLSDAAERRRYLEIVKRLLVWLVVAGASALAFSTVIGKVWG